MKTGWLAIYGFSALIARCEAAGLSGFPVINLRYESATHYVEFDVSNQTRRAATAVIFGLVRQDGGMVRTGADFLPSVGVEAIGALRTNDPKGQMGAWKPGQRRHFRFPAPSNRAPANVVVIGVIYENGDVAGHRASLDGLLSARREDARWVNQCDAILDRSMALHRGDPLAALREARNQTRSMELHFRSECGEWLSGMVAAVESGRQEARQAAETFRVYLEARQQALAASVKLP